MTWPASGFSPDLAPWAARTGALGPIQTVDSHTEGESTRLVVGGIDGLDAGDMPAKRRFLAEQVDYVRQSLMTEPRGHRDLFGAVLTPPAEPGSDFGLVYMDARRYPYLCGHATIGAVTTWLELRGEPPQDGLHELRVDTPSGTVTARARIESRRALSVTLEPEPAFAYALAQPVEVPELGRILVDVVLAGGFFVMVAVEQVGVSLTEVPAARPLADLGMRIKAAADAQLTVQHPLRPYIDSVDVVSFYGPGGPGADGKNAVIYGEAHVDRSPCGTGTCARMALEAAKGRLAPKQTFVNEGPLGSRFTGEIIERIEWAGHPAVRPRIRGRAYLTGRHAFYVTPEDPFPQGYLL